jgi:hypothetical protein
MTWVERLPGCDMELLGHRATVYDPMPSSLHTSRKLPRHCGNRCVPLPPENIRIIHYSDGLVKEIYSKRRLV